MIQRDLYKSVFFFFSLFLFYSSSWAQTELPTQQLEDEEVFYEGGPKEDLPEEDTTLWETSNWDDYDLDWNIHLYPQVADSRGGPFRGAFRKRDRKEHRSLEENTRTRRDTRDDDKKGGFGAFLRGIFGGSRDKDEGVSRGGGNFQDPTVFRAASYSGSNLVISVYKAHAGASLPEMVVATIDGDVELVALASTARAGKSTSNGTYWVSYRHKDHYSSLYSNSPMPYFMSFNRDIGFHGVLEKYYPYIGGKASAGCVRLMVDDAYRLWQMDRQVSGGTKVRVYPEGAQPPASQLAEIRKQLRASFAKRDWAYAKWKRTSVRSAYWPSGMP